MGFSNQEIWQVYFKMAASESFMDHMDMDKVYIHLCSFDELLSIPTVSETTADRVWEFIKKGDITPEILATVPHIRMHKILGYIDFCTLDDYVWGQIKWIFGGQMYVRGV